MSGALWVAFGAAVGAPGRYLTDRWVQSRHRTGMPWGTFTVNVVACLVLGLVAGAAAHGLDTRLVLGLGTGFCGALSTYSTFGYETLRLIESGATRRTAAYVTLSVAVGLSAATVGWIVAGGTR